jgi:hypothetical protein
MWWSKSQTGVFVHQGEGGRPERAVADIEGDVPAQRAGGPEGVQQDS